MLLKSNHHLGLLAHQNRQIWQCLVACALVALAVRTAIVIAGPWVEGDALVYANVARNLLHNGCISMDAWAASTCAPHWGGNQLPGYPTFIAATWWLFGEKMTVPLLAQSVMFTFALCYLCRALHAFGLPNTSIWCVGLALAISPSLAGWSRVLMTEALSTAVAIWVLAEIVRSLAEKKFRTWSIAIACLTGFFIRYDFALMALPVGACALALHDVWSATKKMSVILLIVAAPFGVWTARSVAIGLPAMPPFGLTPQGHALPQGVLDWIATWLIHQYQLESSVWPLATQSYDDINPPDEAYANSEERGRAHQLLSRMRQVGPGEAVPSGVNRGFADLASERRSRDPIWHYGILPIRRLIIMWANPAASMGWPGTMDMPERAHILQIIRQNGIMRGGLEVLEKYPMATLSKGTAVVWRLGSVVVALIVLVISFRKRFYRYRLIIWICLLFVLTRSVVFSQTLLVETRYLTPALAWLDVVSGIGLGWLLWRRRERLQTKGV